jgi:pilus assembly protein Flp/PilA
LIASAGTGQVREEENDMVKRFLKDESGQGMVEYGLIIGLVAIALVVTVTAVNGSLTTLFTKISGVLDTAAK